MHHSFLVCLEFCLCRGVKNKNKKKQNTEALAVKSAMSLSLFWFCFSVARTKLYKKHYKKDHVALYQYIICGPGSQKTKCRSGPRYTHIPISLYPFLFSYLKTWKSILWHEKVSWLAIITTIIIIHIPFLSLFLVKKTS